METGSDQIMVIVNEFEYYFLDNIVKNKRLRLDGHGAEITSSSSSAGLSVFDNQIVHKTSDLDAKGTPNRDIINLYDYITQCNFLVFAEICVNADSKRMNILSDLFVMNTLKVFILMA